MQRNSLTHECLTTKSILLDNAGNINIADPMATSMQTNYDTVFNNRGVKNIYLSPEQCESIQSEKPIINKNPYRNDVFTLGMIMLECALLERQDECYLDDSSHIQWQKVTSGVNRVAQIYSPELKMMIEIMLTRDIWKRMDWISLEKFVHEKKAEKDTAAVDSNKQETQRYNQMPYNTGQTQKLPSKLSEIPSVPYSERSSNISNGISNVLYAQPNFQSNQTSANNYARQ